MAHSELYVDTGNHRHDGIEALKKRLAARYVATTNGLKVILAKLAERAVTYSKDNKGYQDRTANLKNSISYALFLDGKLVTSDVGTIPKPNETEGGQEQVEKALMEYASQNGVVAPQGFSLVIVAGMNYGRYVEDKGYNVLHLTKYYLRDEMAKVLKEVIENVNNSDT